MFTEVAVSNVHISPNPSLTVQDGLEEEDTDFQNDLSSVSGQVCNLILLCTELCTELLE